MINSKRSAGRYTKYLAASLLAGSCCLLCCSAADIDPYAELVTFDFGSGSTAPSTIEKEFRDGSQAVYRQVEAKLLAVLAKPEATHACKKVICEDLRLVGSETSVEPLSKLLTDPKTSDLARLALESIPGKRVDSALLERLKSSDGLIRTGIIQSLATRHNAKLADVLKAYIESGNSDLVRASLQALARVGGSDALNVLKSAKVGEDFRPLRENVLIDAAYNVAADGGKKKALAVFDREYAEGSSLPAVIAAFNGLIDYGSNPAGLMTQALKDKRKGLALAAAKAATRLKCEGITRILSDAFPVVQPEVQVAIVRTIAERGDKAGLAVVKSALASSDKVVQAEAISASEKIGDATVLNDLMVLAVAGAPGAPQAISRLNGTEVNGLITKLLDDPDSAKVRIASAVLKLRDDRSVLPRLMTMAGSDKAELRVAALESMEGFADESEVPGLIALLGNPAAQGEHDRIVAILWKAARSIEKEDDRFLKLWSDVGACQEPVKAAVLPLASAAGGVAPLKIVTDIYGSGSDVMKDRAARTLFKWQNDQAVKPLVELIKGAGDSKYKILGMQAAVRILTDKRCGWALNQKVEVLNQILPAMEREEDKTAVQGAITRLNDPPGKK